MGRGSLNGEKYASTSSSANSRAEGHSNGEKCASTIRQAEDESKADSILYGTTPPRDLELVKETESGVKQYFNEDRQLIKVFIPEGVEYEIGEKLLTGVTAHLYKDRLHRLDGPALEYQSGNEEWFEHGQRHREDGPAVRGRRTEEYWVNDQRHREDGPAVIVTGGAQMWYQWGQLHRLDGPATIHYNGLEEYWIEGARKTISEFVDAGGQLQEE